MEGGYNLKYLDHSNLMQGRRTHECILLFYHETMADKEDYEEVDLNSEILPLIESNNSWIKSLDISSNYIEEDVDLYAAGCALGANSHIKPLSVNFLKIMEPSKDSQNYSKASPRVNPSRISVSWTASLKDVYLSSFGSKILPASTSVNAPLQKEQLLHLNMQRK